MAGKKADALKLVMSIAVCELAGVIGSFFTIPAIPTWYSGIIKPGFSPPNWVFAPVWTLLFLLMGISLYLVWSRGLEKRGVRTALLLFGAQLALNMLWSFLFFGLRSPLYAFVGILALWAAIFAAILAFSRVSTAAALLLFPYMVWVSFAAILNLSIYLLNP